MTKLNRLLDDLGDQSALMVTHFVVINALTGRGVGSGQAVAYNHATGQSWTLQLGRN